MPRHALALALAALSVPTTAFASDPPGTPNDVQAIVIGPGSVRVTWHDTAGTADYSGFFTSSGPFVNFTVEGSDQTGDPSSHLLKFNGYDPGGGQREHWDVVVHGAGARHCFRVWASNQDDNVRSQMPSAWACVQIPPDQDASNAPPMSVGEIEPLAGRRVWFPMRPDGIMLSTTTGYVMAMRAPAACQPPWRFVAYQNGGFPGLGGAQALAPYLLLGLCWAEQLPPRTHVGVPGTLSTHPVAPPAPPPAPILRRHG